MGFDDGLKISLMIKKIEDQKPKPGDPTKQIFIDGANVQQASNQKGYNAILKGREDENQRSKERQKLIENILAQEGLI